MTDVVAIYGLAFLLAWPFGRYIARVFKGERTLLDGVLDPVERGIYRLLGVDPAVGMSWRGYARALLFSNLVLGVVAFLILVFQGAIPLFNPDGISGMRWDLALHTAASFVTNTNQQHYSGQAQLSYFAHMTAIVALQVVTPTVGMVALVAIVRGLFGGRDAGAMAGAPRDLGNYYVDLTRGVTRVALPLAFVTALILVSQGVPSTFHGAQVVPTLDPESPIAEQLVPVGPVAAMVAIKQVGTNGGGWYGPNSSVPLENPTPLSNLVETSGIVLWPIALVFMVGYLSGRRRLGVMVLSVMTAMSIGLSVLAIHSENRPNAAFAGSTAEGANYEGKEVRFGPTASALWGTFTTQTSNGSVNSMHDSFNPLGGAVVLAGMFINATYGGVGVGLINFLLFVIIAVFLAGLMVGRTPELFGRKLEAREVKLASIALLIQPLLVLGNTAIALAVPGLSNHTNPEFHGISQVLYEYTSAFANNGSGFEGLGDDTLWWNVSCAVNLVLGRFIPILAPLAIAGFMSTKRVAPETLGTLRIETPAFAVTTLSVILVLTLLSFLPALALGPIGEQLEGVAVLRAMPLDPATLGGPR